MIRTIKIHTILLLLLAIIPMNDYTLSAQSLPKKQTSQNKSNNRSKTNQIAKVTTTTPKVKHSKPSGIVNGIEAIDLGLSVRWAGVNVGASKPEEFGGYFPYGDPYGTNFITYHTWKDYLENGVNYYPVGHIGDTELDMATANIGHPWRLPTEDEAKELIEKCKKE